MSGYGSVAGVFATPPPPATFRPPRRASTTTADAWADTMGDFFGTPARRRGGAGGRER